MRAKPHMPSQEATALARRLSQPRPSHLPTIAEIRRDLAEEFAPRAKRAALRFEGAQCHETIAGVRCLTLTPQATKSDTVILYLFGGGYVSGAPEYELPIAAQLCMACRMKVVLPQYPLAPEDPAPHALRAAQRVFDELATRHPVLLSGESAGGGLALCLSETCQTPAHALCLFSPWVDLTEVGHEQALDTDPTIGAAHLRVCAQAYVANGDPAALSPTRFALPNLPPTLITTGTRDIMLPSLETFATRHDVQLKVWPGMWHVFELYDEIPEAACSLAMAARFLSEHAA